MPKANDPPVDEMVESINFEVEVTMKRALQQIADKTERSLSGLIRLILKQYLDGKGTL